MFAFGVLAATMADGPVAECFGDRVGVRIVRANDELVEELIAKDSKGRRHTVLLSPTHPALGPGIGRQRASLLQASSTGLYSAPPTFGFQTCKQEGQTITLEANLGKWKVVKTLDIPAHGDEISVDVQATTDDPYPQVRYLLSAYAFAPEGQPMSKVGAPDATFAPAFRPADGEVMNDHFFRSPLAMAQKGPLSAGLMPDLDVLANNRPIPTLIDLDCKNGVVDAPLVAYGFADARLVGHVYYTNDASMVRPVPGELHFRMNILLDAETPRGRGIDKPTRRLWERYGARYFPKVLPQAMPFAEYAKVCYPAAFHEKMTGGWFEQEIDGQVCGGVPAGWGLESGWVSWQAWFNQLRSAWGLRWWGQKLGEADWVAKADKMLNLALAAPMKEGAVPTTYLSRTKEWKGSLITPDKRCQYDLTNIAWKGIWLLRWLEFPDCPRRSEVERQVREMAGLIQRFQHGDGSFPTWLDSDLKVVPVLDRSAQSGLPAWFLARYTASKLPSGAEREKLSDACGRAAKFLMTEVVPQARYYDFETFFSCSPKKCLQRDQKIDDRKMWDEHTMQPPQNTLSMQWTAEALGEIAKLNDAKPNDPMVQAALQALDTMCLYQNVWPISYRKVAYTYGGFGVQNSDGEYNDARQAQFGATLCDFGAWLGRQDLFERGVAAARASLTLINHPLHEKLGIYPNPNYPLGLEPENCGHGGTDQQDGRTGFDWGEGSGLAGIAEILNRYGDRYAGVQPWSVTIDGGFVQPAPTPRPALGARFDFADWRMPGWSFDGDFLHWPTRSRRVDFHAGDRAFIGTCEDGRGGFDDSFTGTIVSPEFTIDEPYLIVPVGGGSGPGVYVELVEGDKQLFIERGRNAERMDLRTWDVSGLKGHTVRLRIVDRERGGWGHINVGRPYGSEQPAGS